MNKLNNGITESEDIEIQLLLDAIYLKHGYDFKGYSHAHMKRRINRRMTMSGISSISEMQHKVLYEKDFFKILLSDFSINVTEMFRDPMFYKSFREEVIPILKTYPFIKIWHAGCSTGEEVYSMAVLLKEEGLYDRTQIYATDFNEKVLHTAKEGIYPIDGVKENTFNYQQAGGKSSFSDYYMAQYESIIFDQSLRERIIFAEHNLVTDGVFGEMNVILCRNVLIYFDTKLQNKVIKLFSDSLGLGCFLCLGTKESLKFSESSDQFEIFIEEAKIYRKKIRI